MTRAAGAEAHPIDHDRSAAPVSAFILLTLRVLLGGIFCFAAYVKLHDPLSFAEAIRAFKIVESQPLIFFGTYTFPWAELFAGAALIVGFWTREAAAVIGLLLLMFIGAIVIAIGKGLAGTTCSCFGVWHLVCTGGVGWCKVWENSVLTAIAGTLVVTGGGKLAMDRLLTRS